MPRAQPRWDLVHVRERIHGADLGDPIPVYAQRFDRAGRVLESGELQLAERDTVFRVRAEPVLDAAGDEYDLPAKLLTDPTGFVVVTDGGRYFVASCERVTSPPGRYLTVRATFKAVEPRRAAPEAVLWPGGLLLGWPGVEGHLGWPGGRA